MKNEIDLSPELLDAWRKHGHQVFATKGSYLDWLQSPTWHFYYLSPLTFIERGGSVDEVKNLLGRIAYKMTPYQIPLPDPTPS